MSRTGRTIGAAVGAVLFVLFFAELAARLDAPGPDAIYIVSAR